LASTSNDDSLANFALELGQCSRLFVAGVLSQPVKDERGQPISGGISFGKQNRNEESMPIYTIAQYQVKPSGTEKVKGAIEEFVRYVKANEPGTRMYAA
jgi:hypothetical protein